MEREIRRVEGGRDRGKERGVRRMERGREGERAVCSRAWQEEEKQFPSPDVFQLCL